MVFGKIVVFDSNTHSKFENSLKILKTHSNLWCRGASNKHHAAERWDLEFGFRSLMFAIKYLVDTILNYQHYFYCTTTTLPSGILTLLGPGGGHIVPPTVVYLRIRRGVRSDAQLRSTETQFQKCWQSGKNGSKHPIYQYLWLTM